MRVRFSFAAVQVLKGHHWPGNIRELKNVVARARALFGSHEIKEHDVIGLVDRLPQPNVQQVSLAMKANRSVIREIELEMIKNRLLANHGNQRRLH